jgi:hypothetical protein
MQGKGLRFTSILGVVLGALVVSGCHSSKFQRSEGAPNVADYRVVVVGDFPPRDANTPKTGRATLQDATAAGQRFAMMLEEELRLHGVRGVIRRGAPEPGALLVEGELTRYDPGNAFLRGTVGFGLGGADFEATVRLADADSRKVIGIVAIDKQSFPVAGVAGALHDVDILIRTAAERAAMEVAIAQGALKRGRVPAGKLRRQVGCGRGGPGCGQDD